MNKEFFIRNAEIVARELLGKVIVCNIDGKELRAKIVETEAYFDEKDPASRACQNGDLRETMLMGAGTVLVYGVHNNWLVNFVTGFENEPQAVLIRAVEPLNFLGKGNGPGLLTKSLGIDKRLHKSKIGEGIWVEDIDNFERDKERLTNLGEDNQVEETRQKDLLDKNFEIIESFRIGVTKDLEKPLRFYVNGNKWVSRR